MVAERLALVDVRDVHLDDRPLERSERVENRHRRVAEGGGIDDDAARPLPRLVDPVDDLVFAIALPEDDLQLEFGADAPVSARIAVASWRVWLNGFEVGKGGPSCP